MLRYLKLFLQKEVSSFQKLTHQSQMLFLSILLYNLAAPILFLFVDAFIWRKTNDVQAVALYMLVNYLGLPIGFYINAILLKKWNIQKLYLVGNIVRGSSVILLIFITHINYQIILTFGLLSGISGGLHWANRNFMTLRMTKSENRIYFASIDNASSILTSIVIPAIIGSFILFGTRIHRYSPIEAYQIISVIAFLLLVFSGAVIRNVTIPMSAMSSLLLFRTSPFWIKLRLFNIIHGLLNGMLILMPVLITLIFLGKEDILGTVQSSMALLSAFALYSLGKIMKTHHRFFVLAVSLFLAALGGWVFGITGSILGVICYLTLQAFSDPFNEVCFASITYDAMDKEENKHHIHHYRYILDQEIFHNLGRILGIIFFIFLLHYLSQTMAMRTTLIILSLTQILLLYITKKIEMKTGSRNI